VDMTTLPFVLLVILVQSMNLFHVNVELILNLNALHVLVVLRGNLFLLNAKKTRILCVLSATLAL